MVLQEGETYRKLLPFGNTVRSFSSCPAPMTDAPPYLSTGDVADRKGCTRMAVRNAIQRGDLNALRVGRAWAVADDDVLASWSVKETGGRAHKARERGGADS